jgi:alkylation response protein AidB-like acyl-CoA dehydrogenase
VRRLAQLQTAGEARDEHSALVKAFCTVRMRETVGYARELLGGNGILLPAGAPGEQYVQPLSGPSSCGRGQDAW